MGHHIAQLFHLYIRYQTRPLVFIENFILVDVETTHGNAKSARVRDPSSKLYLQSICISKSEKGVLPLLVVEFIVTVCVN